MKPEPRVSTVPLRSYYDKELQDGITAWNDELDAIHTGRERLKTTADELRDKAIAGELDKPEKLMAEVDKLRAKSIAADVAELRLIRRKAEFQTPVLEARKVEKHRAAELCKKRVEQIEKGLDAIGTESRFRPALISGDARVLELKAQQGAVSQYERIVTEEDEARLALLQSRLAAAVPTF